ncbi:Histidine kinase 2 [Vitis vinifera]|uniref:histidine kinase n=1 Tax=Vitis vinifera TaxID=29760 RepID=A0A438IEJ3_VITVI|nr:Histidine kinase 2 [Vitis vinifera]
MMELKVRAEAADVAKSQDYAETAHASGKDLISLINEVLDQAKIESGRLELEAVPFDLRAALDNVLSLFSGKSHEKGIELAVYISDQVPEFVIGDPGRFRQIITNLVGNSIKFTLDKGHIFVSVHLADEVVGPPDLRDEVLRQSLNIVHDSSNNSYNTLSGFPVVNRWKSWEKFKKLICTDSMEETSIIKLLVTVEDTGVGIPSEAQSRIFMPFMQADSSTSRTYGGTGIGLSISKRLVDLMGGGNWIQSSNLMNPAGSEFQGLRALVVDCRSIRAEVTRYHLRDWAYHASTSVAMVLVDKEVWDKEAGLVFHHMLKELRPNGTVEVQEKRPKIFLLDTSLSSAERNELKSAEVFGIGKRKQANRGKPLTLGNLLREKRILVVDDNAVNRRVAEFALKKYGAIVTCVDSGKAALLMLKPPHNFDACFMDLQMPEMDGFKATQEIRRMESKVNERIKSGEVSIEMFANVAYWHTPILAMTADVIQAIMKSA